MKEETLKNLLKEVADGNLTPNEAVQQIKTLPYEDLDYAKIDRHRELRTGYPEVVFCLGKTEDQVAGIMSRLIEDADLIMGTKASLSQYEAVKAKIPAARYYEVPGIIAVGESQPNSTLEKNENTENDAQLVRSGDSTSKSDDSTSKSGDSTSKSGGQITKKVAVVTAGTADMPIAEEAAVTAELYGEKVERFYDVGVAGIHRLTENLPKIREANVIIVVAGMEGALASVVGGLVDKPVIAVPTSIGYGSSMGGMAALFSMLNSCSLGVSVMNIDNGFGAGHLASIINGL